MDGIALKDPNLKKVQPVQVKVGDKVLKDAVLKEVVRVHKYRTRDRHWRLFTFDDGTDLSVPTSCDVLVLQEQMALEGV